MKRRHALLGGAALAVSGAVLARAATPLRIGVLTEMSGAYAEDSGQGSVVAARMAIDDFRRTNPPFGVDLISGDAQTKPDVASSLARSWYDRDGVDAIIDVPVSNCALAVATVTRERNKPHGLRRPHQHPAICSTGGRLG